MPRSQVLHGGGAYYELGIDYRLAVSGGHVSVPPEFLSGIANNEGVGIVLNALRTELNKARSNR